jgi:hypothetical protein
MLQICRRGQKSTNSLRRSEAWVEAYCTDSKVYDPASGDDSSSEEEVISAPGRDKGPEKPKAEEKPKEDPSPSTGKMKIPSEFLITPSSKPLVIPAAKNRKSSSNVVTISVTSDSEEEAQEGKQAMRVSVRLPPLVCHSSVEKPGGAIFVVPMTGGRGPII